MSEHGTTSRYTQGCRCARCRAANAGYQRAYQARRVAPIIDASTTQTYTMSTTPPVYAPTITVGGPIRAPIVANSAITVTQTAPGAWTYDVRSPLEQLVDACIDLRDAFAAYHQAHTQEPA